MHCWLHCNVYTGISATGAVRKLEAKSSFLGRTSIRLSKEAHYGIKRYVSHYWFQCLEIELILDNPPQHIRDLFTSLGTSIQNLVNFGEKETKKIGFGDIGMRTSRRWPHIYPDEPQLLVKMFAMTYLAITRREGGPYISKSEGTVYDWPKKL